MAIPKIQKAFCSDIYWLKIAKSIICLIVTSVLGQSSKFAGERELLKSLLQHTSDIHYEMYSVCEQ